MRKGVLLSLLLVPLATSVSALKTGPEVGTKIPDFTVQDQTGKARTFADLTGPEGLLLLFYRTADW
ncbi:MAG: hypothetical protein AAF657_06995 [Acidobacteriota bacterium]